MEVPSWREKEMGGRGEGLFDPGRYGPGGADQRSSPSRLGLDVRGETWALGTNLHQACIPAAAH